MGLAAASVPNLSTDAAETMAPALTEPVTQSDISGQSPRPGDSITPHTDTEDTQTVTATESATENQRNLLNNGKNKFLANGQSPIIVTPAPTVKNNNCRRITSIEENHLTAPDDQVSSRSRRSSSAHMDQSDCSRGDADQNDVTPPQPHLPQLQSSPSMPELQLPSQPQQQRLASPAQSQPSQSQSSSPPPQLQSHIQSDLSLKSFDEIVAAETDTAEADALAVVNNNMGLPKDFGKEANDVEQMLGDLAASGDIDLMSVIKTLESTPSDGGFDLAGGLSLFNDVNDDAAINDVYEDERPPSPSIETQKMEAMREELIKQQIQMKRKCDFLLRRVKKLQARSMMQHTAQEVAGIFEHCQRFMKDKERERNEKAGPSTSGGAGDPPQSSILSEVLPYQPPPGTSEEKVVNLRPVSRPAMHQLIKRLESTAAYQRATLSKRQIGCKYFSSQLTEPAPPTSGTPRIPMNAYTTVPRFEDKVIAQLDQMSGLLHAEMRIVQKALDSDATASSSGGESADEMIVYSNPTQERVKM